MTTPAPGRSRDPLAIAVPSSAINHSRVVRSRGHVARLHRLNHDTFELVVACAAGSRPLAARAGQFATLAVAGVERPRPYSFARDPRAEAPGEHTFHIRLVPGGAMSAWLAAGDRTGERIEIAGPLGSFGLDDSASPMLLLAGGSGFSAIKALSEAACRRQLARDCVVVHGARTRADLYGADDMARIAASWHPAHRFTFVQVLSEEPRDSPWAGARGLVTDAMREVMRNGALGSGAPGPAALRAWVCGPPPMITAARAALLAAGVPAAHVYVDVFADARSPAPVIDNRQCVLCDECLLVRPVAGCIVETGHLEAGADGRLQGHAPLRPTLTAGLYYNALVVDAAACLRCYACVSACPHGAISPDYAPRANSLRGDAAW
ncbi:MAG: FAD-binding oxidoreductase [Gammaproteobacteria bacterium]